MTKSYPPATIQNSNKSNWLSGCILTLLAVLFGVLGVFDLIYGPMLAYIFFSGRMLSPASIAIILIIICDCIIYFVLAFRIKRQHWLVSLALLIIVWLVLPLPLRLLMNTTTMRVRNDGYSMEPSLSSGSYILADRKAYQQHLPQRGDLVIFKFPASSNSDTLLIKRVIGLPGEMVTIDYGQVSIDGVPLNEPYISEQAAYKGEWKIPESQYFVLGDNRNDSRDSHQWGFLPRDNILAKAVWIYWPSTHFGEIEDINFTP